MATRLIESFDGIAFADLPGKWDFVTGAVAIGSGNGRTANGIRLLGTTGGSGTFRSYLRFTFLQRVTWIVGWAIRKAGNPPPDAVNWELLKIMDGSFAQLTLALNSDGTLKVVTGGFTYLATPVQPSNAWIYLELKATIDNSLGSFALHVNEENILSAGPIDTRDAGSSLNSADRIEIYGVMGQNTDLDDIYINDGTGVNNDFWGDTRIYACRPDADGSLKQLTPSTGSQNFAMVDDAPGPDGEGTYNTGTGPGQADTFRLQNLPAGASQVRAAQSVIWARKTDAGLRTFCDLIRQGGVDHPGTERFLSTSHIAYYQPHDVNPATSAPFTVAQINGEEGIDLDTQFGYKIVQ